MLSRSRWFLFALVLIGLCGCKRQGPNIHYKGRTFSQWYQAYCAATESSGLQHDKIEAQEAIRAMGTNALPFLLAELRAEAGSKRQSEIAPTIVFRILGPIAKPAIPELESMMHETNKDIIALSA